MKKNTFLFVLILLVGCSADLEDKKIPLEEEFAVVEEKTEIQKQKYPSLEDYFSSLVFLNGEKPETEPNENLFYEIEGAIGGINVAEFYGKNKNKEAILEEQKAYLAKAKLLEGIKELSVEDPIANFLVTKNLGIAQPPKKQAARNKEVKETLEAKQAEEPASLTQEEIIQLIILREEDGDYAAAQELEATQCEKFPDLCTRYEINFSGWVKDRSMNPVEEVTISVINDPSTEYQTDKGGNYNFTYPGRPHQHLRVRYLAPGYMPQLVEFPLGYMTSDTNIRKDIRMTKADEEVVFQIPEEGEVVVESQKSKYEIEPGQLLDIKGRPYTGEVKAYLYDMDPVEDDLSQVLQGSVRINGAVVPIGQLISYGMAYAEFFDTKDQRLKISAQNPIRITTQVNEDETLRRKNKQGLSEEEFWEQWINEGEFYGSKNTMSSYWVYNLQTGIWDEVPKRIIAPGMVQSYFYTHN